MIANGLSPPSEGSLNLTKPKRLNKKLYTIPEDEEEPMNILRILKNGDPELSADNENELPFGLHPTASEKESP